MKAEMKRRRLGGQGPSVSEIGFGTGPRSGCQQLPDDAAIAILKAALDGGVELIDTETVTDDGRRERFVAEVLQASPQPLLVAAQTPPAAGPWPPSPYCRWEDRYGAAYLRDAVHQRLARLGIERIDLLQLNTWTRAWNDDPQPLLILRQLRDEGKIGLIGICAPEPDQNCAIELMRDGLVDVVQVTFNVLRQEAAAQLFDVAIETRTGVIVRSPLHAGTLGGGRSPEQPIAEPGPRQDRCTDKPDSETLPCVEAIHAACARHGVLEQMSMADVAIKFALSPPAVSTVIVAAHSAEQASQNARVSDLPDLPEPLIRELRQFHGASDSGAIPRSR